MRKTLLPLLLTTLAAPSAVAQISNTGLIAHWRFTSNTQDSSGNAHHGAATAITYTAGRDGMPNSAAVFGTDSSYIAVPYAADLNVVNYSICAVVKPATFNAGPCQSSVLLERVRDMSLPSSGFYNLFFTDNFFDGGDCSAVDTSKYIFGASAGGNASSAVSWQYAPTIRTNEWTSVVATFNGSVTRMYVNGILKATVTTPDAIGTNVQGLWIGSAQAQPTYDFKGVMDDLRLYNRALTDSEVNVYHNPPIPTSVASTLGDGMQIHVSPNPAGNTLTLEMNNAPAAEYQVVDGTGRVAQAGFLQGQNSSIDISSLSPSLYLIRVTSEKGTHVQRFVKQ